MRRIGLRTWALVATLLAVAGCEGGIVPPEGGRPESVVIAPQPAQVEQDTTLQLQVTLRGPGGSILSGRPVFWSSENASIARVSEAGVVTGVAPGTTRVAASSEGISGIADVVVLPRAAVSVAVSPGHVDLLDGATAQLQAVALDRSGRVIDAGTPTWSSTQPSIATVTSSGLVTGVTQGNATITARIGDLTGTATVAVTRRPVVSVHISPPVATLVVGATQAFTAEARGADGQPLQGRTVFWSSSNPAVADVSQSGVVQALAAGATTITALIDGVAGTANVSVSVTPVFTVEVQPDAANLLVGENRQLVAVPKAPDGALLQDRIITWTSSNPAVAAVNGDGIITAGTTGTATITASSEGKTGTSNVTVAPLTVASVEVTPSSAQLPVGATHQFNATPRAANGTALPGRPVSWSSSNAGVASVNSSGLVTAVAAGTATITATSEGQSGTATVTVSVVPVATVEVSPTSATIPAGGTQQFTATTKAQNGTTLSGRPISWSSSNSTVATVNSSGRVTGQAPGTATITATSEGKSGTASVTVTQAPVATVEVSPANATIIVGQSQQLTATPKGANGTALTGRTVTWSTNNAAVATVSTSGQVTAVAPGQATITATSEGKAGTSAITVIPTPVATVEVSPTSAEIIVGQTQQLQATTKAQNGSVLQGRVVTWSTSNAQIATVNSSGLVTAVQPGDVTITATSEGKSGTASVTVKPIPVATVEVSPATPTVRMFETVQLTATTKAADGTVLTGRTVTWQSLNPLVATVDPSGLVRGLLIGIATIRATSEGVQGTATVTVTLARVGSVEVTPPSLTLTVGGTYQLTATPLAINGTPLTDRVVTWSTSNGSVAGANQSGLVTAVSSGEATITATSEGESGTSAIKVEPPPEGTPAALILVSGDGQIGSNNSALPNPLVVQVLDVNDQPVAGVAVNWSTSNGSLSPSSGLTGFDGKASSVWTFGGGPQGTRQATASVAGLPPVVFTATRANNDDD